MIKFREFLKEQKTVNEISKATSNKYKFISHFLDEEEVEEKVKAVAKNENVSMSIRKNVVEIYNAIKGGFKSVSKVIEIPAQEVSMIFDMVVHLIGILEKHTEFVYEAINEKTGEYEGREVELEKPFRLSSDSEKKFGVYVMSDAGNVIMVKFGDGDMEIKRDDPERRKAFFSRFSCDDKKDKTTAGYWSCKAWELDADWV